jgi:hypothetical protein
MPHNELPHDRFIESLSAEADEEYEAAFDSTMDGCLTCDLFAWLDETVSCRMNTDPIHCGGPYRRVKR